MSRDVLTPVNTSRMVSLAKPNIWTRALRFRKQILPERPIMYTDKDGNKRRLDFTRAYNTGLINAYKDKAFASLPYVIAKGDNTHPENSETEMVRGKIEDLSLANKDEEPGLYATLAFPSRKAAASVLNNPDLGVSVRIKEDYDRSDGKHYDAALVHVCGTLDPQVPDMAPWESVSLTDYKPEAEVIDLSNITWKEALTMKLKSGKEIDLTTVNVEELTDTEVDEVLSAYVDELDDDSEDDDEDTDPKSKKVKNHAPPPDGDDDDDDDDDDDSDDEDTQLSARAKRLIDLANKRATRAESAANRALVEASDREWAAERKSLVRSGIPRDIVDLAEPFLHTVDPKVIDLSNGKSVDGSAQMRKILASFAGHVDLSGAKGFDEDPDEKEAQATADAAVLADWDKQHPASR